MAWADLAQVRGLQATRSPRESARFGCSIARMTLSAGVQAGEVAEALATLGCDIVVVRYDAGDRALPALLVQPGWDVIVAAPIIYWSLAVGHDPEDRSRAEAPAPLQVLSRQTLLQLCGTAGVQALVERVVAASFAGYASHHGTNPLLDPAAALAGYQEWALDSVSSAGHDLVALLDGDEPVGIATLRPNDRPVGHLEILLAGLMPAAQGRGWYAHLLAAVERAAAGAGLEQVLISTQVHNTRVQRAWCRFGFVPVQAYATVHLVKSGLLSDQRRSDEHRCAGGDSHGRG